MQFAAKASIATKLYESNTAREQTELSAKKCARIERLSIVGIKKTVSAILPKGQKRNYNGQ